MRTRLVVLISVAALLVGLALGAVIDRPIYKAILLVDRMAAIGDMLGYVEVQRCEGTPSAYEHALADYLQQLDARAANPVAFYPKQYINFDRALTYARLSQLQAQRGALQESTHSLEMAGAFCPQLGWKSCSSERVLDFAQKIDANAARHRDCKHNVAEPSGR